jgi:hypothetical protein
VLSTAGRWCNKEDGDGEERCNEDWAAKNRNLNIIAEEKKRRQEIDD